MKMKRQRGQILIMATIFMAAIFAVLFGLFQSGWTSTEKTRLQAVADASAYSAAMLQARDLNLQAILNRAMVANQVLVGQSVAISSYMQVNQQMWYWLKNIGDLAQYVPYIGKLIGAGTDFAQTTFGTLNSGIQFALSNIVNIVNLTNISISKASQAWHFASVAATPSLVKEVVALNDPKIEIPLLGMAWLGIDIKNQGLQMQRASIDDAEGQSKRGSDRQAADQFRQVILDSRDGFTRARNRNFWDLNLLVVKTRMVQRGGTELGVAPGKKLPYYSWSAVDTVGLQGKSFFCWFRKCQWKEWLPVAWGRQATWHKNTFRWKQSSALYGGANMTNKMAWNSVVTRDKVNGGYLEGTGNSITVSGHYKVQQGVVNKGFGSGMGRNNPGMKDFNYWDSVKTASLCDLKQQRSQSQGCPIRIFITKPDVGFSSLLSKSGSSESTENETTYPNIQALAAAAAIFEPPTKPASNSVELANLYHPYWTARLIEWPSVADRLAAHALAEMQR